MLFVLSSETKGGQIKVLVATNKRRVEWVQRDRDKS